MDWTEERPWGRFKNLFDSEYAKVKLIEVDPNKRMSYQSHEKREESWTIVAGEALVVLEGKEFHLKVGDHIRVPRRAKHRIGNPNSSILRFIEVQTGSSFEESDIQRYQDDFNRL